MTARAARIKPNHAPWRVESLLAGARERTLALVAPVAEEDLNRVHDPPMSPLVWDLGHIAAFEDLWLAVRGAGLAPLRPDLMRVYDADETPRPSRGAPREGTLRVEAGPFMLGVAAEGFAPDIECPPTRWSCRRSRSTRLR